MCKHIKAAFHTIGDHRTNILTVARFAKVPLVDRHTHGAMTRAWKMSVLGNGFLLYVVKGEWDQRGATRLHGHVSNLYGNLVTGMFWTP